MISYLSIFAGFVLTLIFILIGRQIAVRTGFVDKPGGRKKHSEGIPLIGGLVIVPVFLVTAYFSNQMQWLNIPIMAGALILLIMGALDDKLTLNAWGKFIVQLLVAGYVVVAGGVQVTHFGQLFGPEYFYLGMASVPFSILCLVLFMNALNMIDGLDGLSGGVSAIAVFWLIIISVMFSAGTQWMVLGILFACLIAFLIFNMRYPGHPKASVFMGDAGALSLAFLIGCFCILLSQNKNVQPISFAWIIALPIIDSFALFFTRLRTGRHPFDPGRDHIHHRVLALGFSQAKAAAILLAASFVLGLVGTVLPHLGVSSLILFLLWAALLIIYTLFRLKHAANPPEKILRGGIDCKSNEGDKARQFDRHP